jgi:hypothetical protein
MTGRSEKQATEERAVFQLFLRAYPSFAKDVADSTQPDPRPDIEVRLKSGTIVPIELGEWIHGEQLAETLKKPSAGGAYDPAVALDQLQRIVEKKLTHYGAAARSAWLVIHYSRGLLYNTPFRGLAIQDFEGVARWIHESLRGRTLHFERVYLLGAWGDIDPELARILTAANIPFTSGPEAFEVFPQFQRCQ